MAVAAVAPAPADAIAQSFVMTSSKPSSGHQGNVSRDAAVSGHSGTVPRQAAAVTQQLYGHLVWCAQQVFQLMLLRWRRRPRPWSLLHRACRPCGCPRVTSSGSSRVRTASIDSCRALARVTLDTILARATRAPLAFPRRGARGVGHGGHAAAAARRARREAAARARARRRRRARAAAAEGARRACVRPWRAPRRPR